MSWLSKGLGFAGDALGIGDDDPIKEGQYAQDLGYFPPPGGTSFGGHRFNSPGMGNPFTLGQGIQSVASGAQIPGQTAMASDQGGAFSQMAGGIGGAIAGAAGKVGGAIKGAVGWDEMEGMEKAWLLSQAVGTGADIWSQYKQGKQEDEDKKQRQRSMEALRPYIQSIMSSQGR